MAEKSVEIMHTSIRVAIADSSSYVRLVLTDMLERAHGIDPIGCAADMEALVRLVKRFTPDVLLIDYDFYSAYKNYFLERIQLIHPLPILLMCKKGVLSLKEKASLRALGVYEVLQKPATYSQTGLRSIFPDLVNKISAYKATGVPLTHLLKPVYRAPISYTSFQNPTKVIVIGASTGGAKYIEELVQQLPHDFKGCLLLAVHLPEAFAEGFANRLQTLTSVRVSMAQSAKPLTAGQIIVAPGGRDTLVTKRKYSDRSIIRLTETSHSFYDSPSIDLLMSSVASAFGGNSVGIILSGLGTDGTKGMEAIALSGGETIVLRQDGKGVFGMAKSALRSGIYHSELTLKQIIHFIEQATQVYSSSTEKISA